MSASPSTTAPAGSEPSNARRVAFLRSASTPTLERADAAPPLTHRWLHASETGKVWTPFGQRDSAALDDAWKLDSCKKERESWLEEHGEDKEKKGKGAEKLAYIIPPPDPAEDLPVWRVPVAEDRLYEVDLRAFKLSPVFWKGKPTEVLRGRWFFDASKLTPCTDEVADEIEKLYNAMQPWLPSYADELRASVAHGSDAEDKLKAPLKSLPSSFIIFLGPHLARIYTEAVTTRLVKSLWTAWSGEHAGGQLVARGYTKARGLLRTRKGDTAAKRLSGGATTKQALGSSNNNSSKEPKKSLDASTSESETKEVEDETAASASPQPGAAELESESPAEAADAKPAVNASPLAETFMKSVTSRLGTWSAASGAVAAAQLSASGVLPSVLTKRQREQAEEDASKASTGLNADALSPAQQQKAEEKAGEGATEADVQAAAAAAAATETDDEAHEEKEEFGQDPEDATHLVLVWHGIGQKLAESYSSMDFALAVSNMRTLMQKRAAASPPSDVGGGGLASLLDGRRVQFLPVMWRATLDDFEPPPPDNDEDAAAEHLDNVFSLDEILGGKESIPFVKQLISSVALDVPFYLSRHKDEILSRVRLQTNHIWRVFVQRNPEFLAKGGKTSLIAHSLGAAIAADVLSEQPTHATSPEKLNSFEAQLAFDVSSLYLLGSPVALFMWLGRSQLIARKGREGTRESAKDEALDRTRYGCLAVDRIFNVFAATDPIGTRLNCCVDAKYSQMHKPQVIALATAAILRGQPGALPASAASHNTGIFGTWGRSSASKLRPAAEAEAEEDTPDGADDLSLGPADEAKEKEGGGSANPKWLQRLAPKKVKGAYADRKRTSSTTDAADGKKAAATMSEPASSATSIAPTMDEEHADRAQRRMRALSPLGSVDVVIPLTPSLLTHQYMEMLYSHAGYWTDPSFCDFFLATLFSTREELTEAHERIQAQERLNKA